jgi:hypothetical protein
MIGFRTGYEDGNYATRLRADPIFKMAEGALPSGQDFASQSTICRLENLPHLRSLLMMGCGSEPGSRADRRGVPDLKSLCEQTFVTPRRGPAV